MSSLQQIANWKSQRNPLEQVYGGNAICPAIVARSQDSDNAMMILVSPDFEEESKNLRHLYTTEEKMQEPKAEQLKIIVEGHRYPSGHECGRVLNPEGAASTIKENHGEPPTIAIRANNGKGYDTIEDGDSLDYRYPSSETRRGRVGHGAAQTIQTDGGEGQAVCIFDAYNHRDISANEATGTLGTHSCHGSGNCGTFYVGEAPHYRIRKLTERECFRLMGVKDEDSDRVRRHQVKSSMYHLAGDSIVTACLMAIFGEMFDVDWRGKVKELQESISNESTRTG